MFDTIRRLLTPISRPAVDDETRTGIQRIADALQKNYSIVVIYPASSVSFQVVGLTEREARERLPRERERLESFLREARLPVPAVPIVMLTDEAQLLDRQMKAKLDAARQPRPEPPTDEEWAELMQESRERDERALARIEDPEERRLFLLSRGRIEEAKEVHAQSELDEDPTADSDAA